MNYYCRYYGFDHLIISKLFLLDLFCLGIASVNASAPAIESTTDIAYEISSQIPSTSNNNLRDSSSASQATQNEIRLRPEELEVRDSDLCSICMSNPIHCLILECGHMTTCLTCAKLLSKCPICREQITRLVKAFSS